MLVFCMCVCLYVCAYETFIYQIFSPFVSLVCSFVCFLSLSFLGFQTWPEELCVCNFFLIATARIRRAAILSRSCACISGQFLVISKTKFKFVTLLNNVSSYVESTSSIGVWLVRIFYVLIAMFVCSFTRIWVLRFWLALNNL